jgi:DNA repair exonuclease SbcCD ATPase subunit
MAKKPRKSELDAEIQGLYALPLGEFTAARNALATRLRKSGDAAGSDEVKSLPKPTPSAWVVNVLMRRESQKMEALLEAGERARAAQRKAVTGGGAEALGEALHAERDLRDELRRRAAAILEEDGRKASQAMLDRVTANLDAIALSPDAAEAAERGWIHQDLDPPGFEVFAGLQLTARPRHLKLVPPPAARPERRVSAHPERRVGAPEETPKKGRQASKAEQARKREEEAERVDRERREREEAKQRERATRLGARLTEAQTEADAARREVERLEKALADAERAAEEARRRVESLREDAGRARQRAGRAAGKLDRARKDFDAVR